MTYNIPGEVGIFQAIIELAKEHGLLVALLTVITVFFVRRADKATERHIKTLEDEVERVVKERDKLQDIILANRLSSKSDLNGGTDG